MAWSHLKKIGPEALILKYAGGTQGHVGDLVKEHLKVESAIRTSEKSKYNCGVQRVGETMRKARS